MFCTGDEFRVQIVPRDTAEYRIAFHRALGLKTPRGNENWAEHARELLARAGAGLVSIDLLVGGYAGDRLLVSCLAARTPGRLVLVFVSDCRQPGLVRPAAAVLGGLVSACEGRAVSLLEALVWPPDCRQEQALSLAGFGFLTCLRYLCRPPGDRDGGEDVGGLAWRTYSAEREGLFIEAMERSYAQSLDCPELRAIRRTPDVLAGHRAVGSFDPALWCVALRGREPVGVLLLSRHSPGGVMEIVYMGVAQVARGTGVADALVGRALSAARLDRATMLALAVDERNAPARRLYQRWGFTEAGRRRVWIAAPRAEGE